MSMNQLMIFRFDVGDNIPRRPSQKFLFATKAREDTKKNKIEGQSFASWGLNGKFSKIDFWDSLFLFTP